MKIFSVNSRVTTFILQILRIIGAENNIRYIHIMYYYSIFYVKIEIHFKIRITMTYGRQKFDNSQHKIKTIAKVAKQYQLGGLHLNIIQKQRDRKTVSPSNKH